jgi:uncharacterized cupin superfamily protein
VTKPVINIADAPLMNGGNGKQFASKLSRLGPLIGASKLGCMLHIVAAGEKAFPRHAHHVNEEMFNIVSGEGTYRLGEETYPVKAGDLLSAPAGDVSTAHQIVNTGAGELRYLAFSTKLDPDVVEYPDSNKFAVASLVPPDKGLMAAKLLYIGRRETSLGYFDGEE